jgi:F-type H+-transporting ATPase subunit delta
MAAFIVGAGRGHDLPSIIQRFVELAAQSRDKELAEVRSATPLDEATVQRLAESLSRATNKQVDVRVIVDENVLGGLVVTMGDTVIDGTVRHRLEQLKETM